MSRHESANPRLIILTQWFDPEPTPKGLAFAQRMAEQGFQVEVVTGFPNYPGGTVYPGYRIRPLRREQHGQVLVTRLALYPSHDTGKIGRILNYLSFFLSAFVYLTFGARRADVFYVYHPPLTTALAAACAGWLRRTPFLVDIQDLWPDTLRATGMIGNSRILRVVDWLCRWVYRRAAHIVVLSNGFRNLLTARGVPAERISVIPNWADESAPNEQVEATGQVLGPPGPFRVLFAGNMGPAQDLDTVLDAATLLADAPNIELCLLGSGLETDRLTARRTAEGIDNVRFLPRVSPIEAQACLRAADALLVHLRDDPLFAITIPSKTQAYLVAGRPVIMAVAGDAADMIRSAEAGVATRPGDPEELAKAIRDLASLAPEERAVMGANGQRFYYSHLSLDIGTRRFATLLRDVIR
ncbi:glycosyltransferase family 4 protein [Pararhodobacter sp.]|uniref:glycosyltransferase family 4 protein n=1 Tax=Pararhodobacter sp. TaxID=2127056 RepID=UPI002AFF7639|nr:glycosyltransferase family 4 protein [Pararhodobacter sp.]